MLRFCRGGLQRRSRRYTALPARSRAVVAIFMVTRRAGESLWRPDLEALRAAPVYFLTQCP